MLGVKSCYTYDHIPHVRFELVEIVLKGIESQVTEISELTCIPLSVLKKRLSNIKNCGSSGFRIVGIF